MAPSQDSNSTPTEAELTVLAGNLAADQTTMTLATTAQDEAWAAPVYYVFFRSAFYFLSSPESRHIREALEKGRASSAIFASGSTWQEIRGLQMTLFREESKRFRGCANTLKNFRLPKNFSKTIRR
jgi:uncharacterized protein YhbP (UPF0306 family)